VLSEDYTLSFALDFGAVVFTLTSLISAQGQNSYVVSDSGTAGCGTPSGQLIKVTPSNGTSTVISTLTPGPGGVATDPKGNIFVVQPCGRSVSKISPMGTVSVLFSGSPLQSPVALAVDASGNIIVGDNLVDEVFRIPASGNSIVEIAHLPFPTPIELQDIAITVDGLGSYIVAEDSLSGPAPISDLSRINPNGSVSVIYRSTTIQSVGGLVIDAAQDFVIADYLQSIIYQVTQAGDISSLVNGPVDCCMIGLAIDPVSFELREHAASCSGARYDLPKWRY
jgi:hypothetical protein